MNEIDFNLGAIEEIEKPSAFQLGSIGLAEAIPEVFINKYTGKINHQHKTPSCGAHAGVTLKNIQENKDFSPAYLWKRIKQIDGFKPEDGTSMDAIFRALKKYGVCEKSLLANNTLDTLDVYTDPSVITKEMDDNASNYKIESYAFTWNPSSDEIKKAIYENKAVIMLLRIGAEFWTPSWLEKDILPLKSTFKITSGHFVVAHSYDKEFIYFVNEWGESWGRVGIGYFDNYYMPRCVQIGTAVDIKNKYTFTNLLKYGMIGSDVSILQKVLKENGYLKDKIDGIFGPKTKSAVIRFQIDKQLSADGIVGKNTNAELNKLIK